MNTHIHVIHSGLTNINSRGFVFPLWYYRHNLQESGFRISFSRSHLVRNSSPAVIFLDSKVLKEFWQENRDTAFSILTELKKKCGKLFWFNTADSTGLIQQQVFPYVDRYLKSQLLVDRQAYRKSYYGQRVYTDYYHREFGILDDNESFSAKLNDKEIQKLGCSWNFGMANIFGYVRANLSLLDSYTKHWILRSYPNIDKLKMKCHHWTRPVLLSARLRTNYERNTVAYQRQYLRRQLEKKGIKFDRLTPINYFKELKNSQFSLSPFGWGEVNVRDFESVVCGSVLVKPDMSHIETYPNIYKNNSTYVSLDWDLSNSLAVVETLPEIEQKEYAMAALEDYGEYVGRRGGPRFVRRIMNLVEDSG